MVQGINSVWQWTPIDPFLWFGLFVLYFILDGVATKNVLSTTELSRVPASNTSALLYLFSTVGSIICVAEGTNNIIPICVGAWFGTYATLSLEIELGKRRKSKFIKRMLETISKLQRRKLRILQSLQRGNKKRIRK